MPPQHSRNQKIELDSLQSCDNDSEIFFHSDSDEDETDSMLGI